MNVTTFAGQSPTARTVNVGALTLVFSYDTIVAFAVNGVGWFASENVWSMTTGKHLNQETPVSKADRIPHAEFRAKLDAVLAGLTFDVNAIRAAGLEVGA